MCALQLVYRASAWTWSSSRAQNRRMPAHCCRTGTTWWGGEYNDCGGVAAAVLEIVLLKEQAIVVSYGGHEIPPRPLTALLSSSSYSVRSAFEHCFWVNKKRGPLHGCALPASSKVSLPLCCRHRNKSQRARQQSGESGA